MDQATVGGSGDIAIGARGVLRAREVRREAGMTLVLVAAPDLDIAAACAGIGRRYGESWPPIVVLPPPPAGSAPSRGEDLAARLEQVARDPHTVHLRRGFLDTVTEVLESGDVSEDHYFFVDAGGDSVTALQLSAAVEERFGFELPLEVLVALTIGGIAGLLATCYLTTGD
jgi:acyl carrier protein